MDVNDFLVGFGGAAMGWLVGVFTDAGKDFVWRWRLKRKILDEVQQLYGETENVWRIYALSLQGYGAGVISGQLPLPLSSSIYDSHYGDAAIGVFSRQQRTHVAAIYNYVKLLNRAGEELQELQRRYARQEISKSDFLVYGDRLKNAVMCLATARWSMHFYLTNTLFPDPTQPEAQADYQVTLKNAEVQIDKYLAIGKKVGPKPFLHRGIEDHLLGRSIGEGDPKVSDE